MQRAKITPKRPKIAPKRPTGPRPWPRAARLRSDRTRARAWPTTAAACGCPSTRRRKCSRSCGNDACCGRGKAVTRNEQGARRINRVSARRIGEQVSPQNHDWVYGPSFDAKGTLARFALVNVSIVHPLLCRLGVGRKERGCGWLAGERQDQIAKRARGIV